MRTITVNPVLERELRQRLRGRPAWIVLTLYLAVLAVILRLVYDIGTQSDGLIPLSQAEAAAGAGRAIFHWLLFFMLGLICFIVPGLTAAAIAGERERQTLIPLQVTLLRPRSIVFGKLLASLAYVVLLLIASLPLLSVSFLLGGVDVAEVSRGMAMLLVVAVAVACLSLACSSIFRRTQTATVAAYGIVAALVLGTPIAYGAQRALDTSVDGTTSPAVLVVNPFAATAEVVRGRALFDSNLPSPFRGIQSLLEQEVFTDDTISSDGGIAVVGPAPAPPFGFGPAGPIRIVESPNGQIAVDPRTGEVVGRGGVFAAGQQRPRVAGMPFWTASLLSFAVLGALAVLLSVRRLTIPSRGRGE
jgi:ABC-2 type transport system permease protein